VGDPTLPGEARATDGSRERFLVTGALGCIGAWTVKALVDEGVTVVPFDRATDPRRLRLVMGDDAVERLTIVEGDVTDLAALGRALDEHAITNVIHLASLQVPFVRADPPLGGLVNVAGTVNVFEAVKARHERIARVVFAGSAGMFHVADAGEPDAGSGARPALRDDTTPHPRTHYGVYKLANEGNARVYWFDDGIPSVSLRPMTVLGPGRDQGLTSAPTRAIVAAILGQPFRIGFGGRMVFQYAPDVARTFVAASRSDLDGARAYNLPGSLASMDELIAIIDRHVPGAADLISHDPDPLPFPEAIEASGIAALGELPVTPLDEAIERTVGLFRGLASRGRLVGTEHGLAA
jgi:nucleoside-diphosphate-sugar epimerase